MCGGERKQYGIVGLSRLVCQSLALASHPFIQLVCICEDRAFIAAKAVYWEAVYGMPPLNCAGAAAKVIGYGFP
jgi:hypothetical protein